MKNIFLVLGLVVAGSLLVAFSPNLAPKRASAPYYDYYGKTTLTNAATIYHTLENAAGDDLWFPDASTISVQIAFDETSGTSSTVATLQGTNQLDAASATWVDIWSPAAWTADEDTLISITPVYANYRLKFAQTGTATSTVRTDWIVE